MASTWEAGIESTGTLPDGVDYRFPRRNLGRARVLLWAVIAIILLAAYALLEGPIWRLFQNGLSLRGIVIAVFWSALSFLLFRYPLWFCLNLLLARREVELRVDSLCTGERIGRLRRRGKRWPLKRIKRLQIVDLLPLAPPPDSGPGLEHLHVLTGVLEGGKRFVIAPGYPRALLTAFVEELSKQIALAVEVREELVTASEQVLAGPDVCRTIAAREPSSADDGPDAAPIQPSSLPAAVLVEAAPVEAAPAIGIRALFAEITESLQNPREPEEYHQPPGSKVEVEWFPDGLTLRVPRLGVWRGSHGLFTFGIIWSASTLGFASLFLCGLFGRGAVLPALLTASVILSVFGLIGAGILFAGWKMGNREAVIAVVADNLMVMDTGVWRAQRREWPRSEIRTVRVGPSGIEVNDDPLPELQIHGAKKKLFGTLAGRDNRELLWMATLLRQSLRNAGPLSPPNRPTDKGESSTDGSELPAATKSDEGFDYHGMTINERLLVARLSDEFADAVKRRDRADMLTLLRRVQLPEAGAAACADAVLSDPRHYGY